LLDADRPRERRRVRPPVGAGFFHRPLHPADRIEIDPKLVRQMAARPDRRGLRVKRHAHPLAFEILRGADVGLRVDEDVAMTKDARGKYWQGDERTVATSHEAESSATSNSSPPTMRSKISRPDANAMVLRSMPSGTTSPARMASIRS